MATNRYGTTKKFIYKNIVLESKAIIRSVDPRHRGMGWLMALTPDAGIVEQTERIYDQLRTLMPHGLSQGLGEIFHNKRLSSRHRILEPLLPYPQHYQRGLVRRNYGLHLG